MSVKLSLSERLKLCLMENQYIVPSYEIYGGLKGFQDYGMLGTRVKNKLIDLWRDFFLFENDIVEIEGPTIMPYDVLKASGHVDMFSDFIVYDGNNICYRADHLLEDYFRKNNMENMLNQIASYNANEMTEIINKYKILNGGTEKEYKPVEVKRKNLMFDISQNSSQEVCFLRPETAQNIFPAFKSVNEFWKKDLPFGIAQVGHSYRREISPTPFTRMREFNQMEIEWFIDPHNTKHPKIEQYLGLNIPLLSSVDQLAGKTIPTYKTIKLALEEKTIIHETMAYFLARVYDFGMLIGLKKDKIRFRQHMPDEKSHYSEECWDFECFVNNKWLECIGIADRSDYDLKSHSHNNLNLTCHRKLDNPTTKTIFKPKLDMKSIAAQYKENASKIKEKFESLSQDELALLADETIISINDQQFKITKNQFIIEQQQIKQEYEEFYPHVIEPSIGVDRLLYAMFEHCFWVRQEDEQRIVLSIPDKLTPYDVAILTLHKKPNLIEIASDIKQKLKNHKIFCYEDSSNTSIGKRYSRLDEIGIKYTITIDPGSLIDNQVTIRERDTMKQIRIAIKKLPEIIKNIHSFI